MEPTDDQEDPPRSPAAVPRSLVGLIAVGAAALIAGLIAWFVTSGEEVAAPTTPPPDTSTTAPAPSTTGATTTTSTSTTSTTSTTTSTTEPATTTSGATTTSAAPTTAPPPEGPSGERWTVDSPNFPEPFTLDRVAQTGGASAYDGAQAIGGTVFRCVAVVFDGEPGWQEWCGEAGSPTRFVAVGGIDAWVVGLGDPGVVTLDDVGPNWSVPTNGCVAPIVALVAAAELGGAAPTGVVCAGDEAVMRFAGTLLRPTGGDGGAVVLADGDEGWNVVDIGTSFGCADTPDLTARCAAFGVGTDLFDAILPIPPLADPPASDDVVAVEDTTTEVAGWVADETDPATIETIVLGQVSEPDAEVPATSQRTTVDDRLELLTVVVPQLDDSIRSVTWAVWIDQDGVVRATTWATCARGVVGGLCV